VRAIFAVAMAAAACGLIPVPDVSIDLSANGQTELAPGASVMLQADVRHTNGMPQVTWSLTGAACPAACGALSMIGDFNVTYTAPPVVFAASTVTITATSVKEPTKTASITLTLEASVLPTCGTGGSDGALSGSYAFLLRGGGATGPFALIGSLVTDGAGHIVSGTIDVNRAMGSPSANLPIDAAHSSYAIGADGRGCVAITTPAYTVLLHVAVGAYAGPVATSGRAIEFDAVSGSGSRAEGFLRRQDPSSFAALLHGSYAFGFLGTEWTSTPMAAAGVFTADQGVLSDGMFASVGAGTPIVEVTGQTGTYAVGADGRGTLVAAGARYASYAVSSSEILALAMDPIDMTHPLLGGELRAQVGAPFDARALAGPAIFYAVGHDPSVGSAGTATIAQWTTPPDPANRATLIQDRNDGGTFTAMQSAKSPFTVLPNGHATLFFDQLPAVVFLVGPDDGFMVMKDPGPSFGIIEPQTGGPFGDGSLSGTYSYGTLGIFAGDRVTAVGAMTVEGTGLAAIEDEAAGTGTAADQDVSSPAFAVDATGRATLDPDGHRVGWIISPGKLVYVNTPAGRPRAVIVEK
jgi:hypothetical protein